MMAPSGLRLRFEWGKTWPCRTYIEISYDPLTDFFPGVYFFLLFNLNLKPLEE
jgi:hypothetical protein